MDVVLVTCSIRADAVEQFKADFPEMPPGSELATTSVYTTKRRGAPGRGAADDAWPIRGDPTGYRVAHDERSARRH